MSKTRHFGLPVPQFGDAGRWGQDILDWMNQAERTLGCNTNLVMTADTAQGIGESFTLAHIAGEASVDVADPSDGRWGRLLLQASMVHAQEVMGRLLGISQVRGLSTGVQAKSTIYHSAGSNTLTLRPSEAVLASEGRLQFLPLGYVFEGGGKVFFNGLMPVQICPTRLSGRGEQYKDGGDNPAGDFSAEYDAGPALHLNFDAGGAAKHVDLLFPFVVGGDFDQWVDIDSADAWGWKVDFKTTGSATLAPYSVIDSAGTEHLLAPTGQTTPGSYTPFRMKQKLLHDSDGAFTPGLLAYARLRASGSSSEEIWVRPNLMVQYFPWFRWEV